ncbi:MAG: hypothetical protein AAFU38_05925, partial [Bacteroidota bacterium]
QNPPFALALEFRHHGIAILRPPFLIRPVVTHRHSITPRPLTTPGAQRYSKQSAAATAVKP